MAMALAPSPNPLLQREPTGQRLADFRVQVNDMLLNNLAGHLLYEPAFLIKNIRAP